MANSDGTIAHYWGFHANGGQNSQECEQLILDFLNNSTYLRPILQVGSAWQMMQDRQQLTDISRLHVASYYGMENIVAILLKGGADPMTRNSWGETPLHKARTEPVVSLLLQSGVELESRDIGGETALMHQAWRNCE